MSAPRARARPPCARAEKSTGGLFAGAAMTTRHSGPNGGSLLISPGGGGVVIASPGARLLRHLIRLRVEGAYPEVRADNQERDVYPKRRALVVDAE